MAPINPSNIVIGLIFVGFLIAVFVVQKIAEADDAFKRDVWLATFEDWNEKGQ